MSSNDKPEPKFDVVQYSENRRKIPWKDLEPYAGQWVAISGDGTHVVASGPDIEAAEANLAALGIPGDTVGWARIPALDEDTWL